jgi:(S)-3,5-dihydroxyphenylglycine transaminase
MAFLSEIAMDNPSAISFASGAPAEACFELERWLKVIPRFQHDIAAARNIDAMAAGRMLGQYGRTSGLINDLIAENLLKDYGVECTPDRVIVTNGCQEALLMCLQTLCASEDDVVLARNPTYIGVTGAAALSGIRLYPLESNADESVASSFRRAVLALTLQGKRPRAFYLIPDFDNPTGDVLSVLDRRAVLAVAAEYGVVILEDNPYGMFRFEGSLIPPLAALDSSGTVIFLGTYSKTLCPAVRVGCAALPETLFGAVSGRLALAKKLRERKSFLSVTTSQINQALVGGILLEEAGSLARIVEPARRFYQTNRDVMLQSILAAFDDDRSLVKWNVPSGGFFLSMELPFSFGKDDMMECVATHGVIAMPMSFFALDGSQQNLVRLSFSNVTPEEITSGVERFARYVRDRLNTVAGF